MKVVRRGLIAIVDNDTIGTYQEMVYAKAIFNKEVYSMVLNGKEDHIWLRYHSDRIFTDLDRFKQWINQHNKKRYGAARIRTGDS